ncbi:Vacuolar protein sorting-associated protein 16 -like protein [Toxocara canis]|uniref:Vacuolar protein sorting-associated protein 16 homolog n=1 Tax=Toxocara canis TaxID=6265 RepID=A0A0B2VGQ0_TOXCA|nr:Vacuolar protein sorting-associated protein 16 -like protein [Toxocara canis]
MGSELQDWVYLDTLKLRKDVLLKRTRFGAKESSLFASSPYGGPIAIANSASNASSWEITVETCAGKQLSSIRVPSLHALYWSRCHRLIVVGTRGRVLVYDPLGKIRNHFSVEQEVSVAESRIFYGTAGNTGLAILTETNRIFAVNSVMEPVPWRIPDIYRSSRPTAWNVLTSHSAQMTVLFVMGDNFYAGMQGVAPQALNVQWKLADGEYREIVPNWDCTRIAFSHSLGVVQVVDSDFSLLSSVTIPDLNPTLPPVSGILWCGKEALALRRSRTSLQLISLTSKCHTYNFSGDIRIDAELDGIKVFTPDKLVFLSIVPEEVENVLGIASSEPGAILYEASEKLCKGSHGVYNYFKMIEQQFDKAVRQCLFAAAHQFDHCMQKRLLKAASLGNALLQRHDPSQFVDMCHVMRILNAVRQPYVGMPLSFLQYVVLQLHSLEQQFDKAVRQCLFAAAHQFDHCMQKRLLKAASLGNALLQRHDPSQFVDMCHVMRILNAVRQPSNDLKVETLIDRLIDTGMWPMAMAIAEYMKHTTKGGVHRVLAHWALSKIEDLKAQKEAGKIPNYAGVSELIVKRFSSFPEVSFADVAMKAVDAGLSPMAELLLEKETRLNRQIDMLLKLNKIDKALAKAACSHQPDLLHVVLAHLKRTKTKEVIDQLMLKIPQAMCLYQDYLREEAPGYVLALYKVDDDFARQAIYHLHESETMPWNPFDIKEKVDTISRAEKCLQNLKEPALAQQLSESAALFRICESLDGKPDFAEVNRTSVRSVFVWAAGHQEEALMEQMKKSFKLSDKLYCMWKIEGFALYEKWHHLESFSKTKKLPVGIMPFIEACARHGNAHLAEFLIEQLTSPQEVIDAYLLIDDPIRAAKFAAEKKLLSAVENIYTRYRMKTDVAAEVGAILNTAKANL